MNVTIHVTGENKNVPSIMIYSLRQIPINKYKIGYENQLVVELIVK